MNKVRLLILVGMFFIATAVQASTVAWIDNEGKLIYKWIVADGRSDLYAYESYYACQAKIILLRARNKHE